MERVSVVIPAYNAAEHLGEALESVRAQGPLVGEVIVVDDGSTDATPDVARAYREVRYVRQPQTGPSSARNRGIALAESRWIAFLDADDLWLPGKLETQLSALAAFPEAGWSFSALWFLGLSPGDPRADHVYEPPRLREWAGRQPDAHGTAAGKVWDLLVEGNFVDTCSVVVRAGALHEAGGFDESMHYGEDWDLWLRLARRWPAVYVRRPTARYRQHRASLSGTGVRRTARYYEANVRVLEKHRAATPSMAVQRALGQARAAFAATVLASGRRADARLLARQSLAAWPSTAGARVWLEAACPGLWGWIAAVAQRGARAIR
jgi:glycosyltransferase involved in cell wall biosynthesis